MQSGEEIRVERDEPFVSVPVKSEAKKTNGKKDTKTKGGKKQLSLATMLKPPPTKFVKKKQESIVRITNKGGFGEFECRMRIRMFCSDWCSEFGRLPLDVAAWVSRLLELGWSQNH